MTSRHVMSDGLSVQQSRFVAAYVRCGGNGTQAAIEAGYSPRRAQETASNLVSKSIIAKAIEDRQKRTELSTYLTLADKRAKIAEIVSRSTQDGIILKALELDAKLAGEMVLKTDQTVRNYEGDAYVVELRNVAIEATESCKQLVSGLT